MTSSEFEPDYMGPDDEDCGVYDYSNYCTQCIKKSDYISTESYMIIEGREMNLLRTGERLCPTCLAARKVETEVMYA